MLDNLRTGFRRNLAGLHCTFIEGSITDAACVKEAVADIDYIFHLAAMVSVPESMSNPAECVALNVNGLLNVLEAASAAGCKKLVFSTSAAIYGDNPTVPKLETMYPEPRSPYAITKLDGEYYCNLFTLEGKLKTVCLRYFNVFGPRQDPAGPYAAAVPIFIEKALRNEDIIVHGDGGQTRDFIFVKDIVAANAFFAREPDLTGVYNVAYGGSITIKELAGQIIDLTGSKSKIIFGPERPGDVRHSRAAVDKLNTAGLVLQPRFEEGLKATIEFFSKR